MFATRTAGPLSDVTTLFSSMTHSLNLALLICDTPAPKVVDNYGAYDILFRKVFDRARPANVDISWSDFDVVTRQEYPDLEDIQANKYDGIVITGSARGAYEDEPWIHKLIAFVKQVRETAPETRIVGICFGHQIIAIASGSSCKPNPSGWEFGYTATELTPLGRRYFNTDKTQLAIQEVHKDYVPELPPNFHCLASTAPHTPIQAMVSDDNRVISVQGHPEFPAEVVEILLDVRLQKGILQHDFVQESLKKLWTEPIDDVWVVRHFIDFLQGNTPAPSELKPVCVRVITAANESIDDPSSDQIFDLLSEMNMAFRFVIVKRRDMPNDQHYIQAYLNDDDTCLLEYRAGGPDAHFQGTVTEPFPHGGHDKVAIIMADWASSPDGKWREALAWQRLDDVQ